MNPYFMTEEQKRMQKMMAAAQRQSSPAAGMSNPYEPIDRNAARAAQAQDFTGQEREIERQRAVADSLRGTPMAKGKTVGPSDIYVAPNWAENLQTFGSKLAGGYMDKKANEADSALQPQRLSKAAAMGDLAEDEYQQGLSQQAKDDQVDAEVRELARADRLEAERVRVEELQDEIKREEAEGNLTQKRKIELEELKARLKREELELEAELEGAGVDSIYGEANARRISSLGSAKEREQARTYLNSIKTIDKIAAPAQQLLDEGGSWSSFGQSAAVESAGALPLFGESAAGWAKDKVYTDAEQAVRQDILSSFTEFRRSLAGANLTAMERFIDAAGDPTENGISSETSLNRMLKLRDHMAQRAEGLGLEVSGYERKRQEGAQDANDIPTPAAIPTSDTPPDLPDDVKAVWRFMTEEQRALFR